MTGTTSLAPRALPGSSTTSSAPTGAPATCGGAATLDSTSSSGDLNTDVQMDDPATLPHPRRTSARSSSCRGPRRTPRPRCGSGDRCAASPTSSQPWTPPGWARPGGQPAGRHVVNDGRGLRLSHLAGVALVVGGLSWIGWRIYLDRGAAAPLALGVVGAARGDGRARLHRGATGAALPQGTGHQDAQPDPGGAHPGARAGGGPHGRRSPRLLRRPYSSCRTSTSRPTACSSMGSGRCASVPSCWPPRAWRRSGCAGSTRRGQGPGQQPGLRPLPRREPLLVDVADDEEHRAQIATMSEMRLPGGPPPAPRCC